MEDTFLVSKEVLPSLDGFELDETQLGDPKGSLRQYRGTNGLHVREYEEYFEIHQDKVDPRVDPLGHLVRDSPETLAAFGAASVINSAAKNHSRYFGGLLGFLLFFFSLNNIFRRLKRLLF